jgi:phage-related protein
MASTRDAISRWPDDVRESVYFELQALQTGMKAASSDIGDWVEPGRKGAPPKHKSMRTAFGRHARQLTIKSEDSYRVVYISKFKEEGSRYVHNSRECLGGYGKNACRGG